MKTEKRFKTVSRFKPLTMLIYALIFSMLGYVIIKLQAAPSDPPSIYLTPTSQTLPINTTFTVSLRVNSGTTAVNAVQANLSYPANLLDFVSIDSANSAFTTPAETTGGSGTIRIAKGNTTPLTGDRLVATITFRTRTSTGAASVAFTSGTVLVNSSTNADILGTLSNAYNGTYTVDATAPTVSITAPANNATLSGGSTVSVTANASDNTGVSNVAILVDGTVRATLTSSPYSYSWNTSGLALGAHTLQARASDAYGNTTNSTIVNVTLTDQTAPTVSITAPAAGATLVGTVTYSASASDNTGGTGVNRVEFLVDGVVRNTDTTSPYSFSWDTRTVSDANHTLTARAYDNATPNNAATSAARTVTVDNADHTPPSTPGALTVTNRTLTSITLTWTASTDNIGVSGYRIQRNGNTVITTGGTTLTYTDSNLANGTTYNYSVSAVDGNSNFSTPATVSGTTIPLLPGDINTDGQVNVFDLSILLSNWQTTNANCDLNNNGSVDIFDLSILLSHWTA